MKFLPFMAPLAALFGYLFADWMVALDDVIVPLLMIIMLCMGLTLTPRAFLRLGGCKGAFLTGMILQFSVMPLAALGIATLFRLSPELTVGLVMVGSVAGGTSSNVWTFLARGNVALSVAMTSTSTLAGVVMTPLLLQWLVGASVEVPVLEMLSSLFRIVLVPVVLGVAINTLASRYVHKLMPALAPLAVFAILLILAIIVALNVDKLHEVALTLVAATLLHNVTGLVTGYYVARALGFETRICRTVAIEVGMQNSGLATVLALKFFSPVAALPGALFSAWLNITGSVYAASCTRADTVGAAAAAKETESGGNRG